MGNKKYESFFVPRRDRENDSLGYKPTRDRGIYGGYDICGKNLCFNYWNGCPEIDTIQQSII